MEHAGTGALCPIDDISSPPDARNDDATNARGSGRTNAIIPCDGRSLIDRRVLLLCNYYYISNVFWCTLLSLARGPAFKSFSAKISVFRVDNGGRRKGWKITNKNEKKAGFFLSSSQSRGRFFFKKEFLVTSATAAPHFDCLCVWVSVCMRAWKKWRATRASFATFQVNWQWKVGDWLNSTILSMRARGDCFSLSVHPLAPRNKCMYEKIVEHLFS